MTRTKEQEESVSIILTTLNDTNNKIAGIRESIAALIPAPCQYPIDTPHDVHAVINLYHGASRMPAALAAELSALAERWEYLASRKALCEAALKDFMPLTSDR